MSKLKILNSLFVEQGTIEDVLSSSFFEEINGAKELSFSTVLTPVVSNLINDTNIVSLDGDYYDIAAYKKSQSGQNLQVDVECEHISYRLNDPEYNVDYFTYTGSPTYVLGKILEGTPFTVGTVELIDNITYSAQEAKSRRGLLMEYVVYIGGEISFNGFEVSILNQRGSSTPKDLTAGRNITVISKNVNKRERDSLGNPIVSYECDLVQPMELNLGDVVTLEYDRLDINISLRIVNITKNPYNKHEVSFQVGNKIPGIQDDIYRIQTTTVIKNKVYNGTRIGPDDGFVATRSDNKARVIMNATEGIKIQKGDGSGNAWEDVIFLDTDGNGNFTGKLVSSSFEGGSIDIGSGNFIVDSDGNVTSNNMTVTGGSITITRSDNYAKVIMSGTDGFKIQKGDGTGTVWTDVMYIDVDGNANFTGIITGGLIRTAAEGRRIEISDNQIRHYNDSNVLQGMSTNNQNSNYGDIEVYDGGGLIFKIFVETASGVWLRQENGKPLYIGVPGEDTYCYGNWTGIVQHLTQAEALAKTDWLENQLVEVTDEELPLITDNLTSTSTTEEISNKINSIIQALDGWMLRRSE